ncbi:hypothetical protein KBY55_19885 [Streptomyces sp. b94]|uniref:hypothetical protein n=1 Tax=Streptomyces sp. b94 TaxID=1827634 RepID=UPI001B37F6AA|nr:hypothetical protein [Streptomyces sp. b94]MBQ1098285.1 hypothetical protein [Streptomyces sp. b94]
MTATPLQAAHFHSFGGMRFMGLRTIMGGVMKQALTVIALAGVSAVLATGTASAATAPADDSRFVGLVPEVWCMAVGCDTHNSAVPSQNINEVARPTSNMIGGLIGPY